jgi:hypothetical protein
LPDRQSGDLSEVAIKLEPRSREYDDFEAMVRHGSEPLDPLFAATLQINRSLSPSDDLQDAIYAFWAGGRVNITQVRKALRPLPNTGLVLKAKKSADLAADRFRFASGLIRAGGYRGWVILIDEVELVASLSQRARARAYVDLTWILGFSDRPLSGVLAVAAATSEFTGVIFNEKQDDVKIPLSKMAEKEPALVERAVRALRAIDERSGNWEPIEAQTDDDLDRVFREVRELYRLAFDWEGVGKARPPYRDVGRSMRMHVREWITRWDLERLDPLYSADIAADVLRPDLEEREGLEGFSEPDDSDDGSDWSGGVVAY